MPVGANGLGGLKAMLDLGEIGIGVAIVHQSVQVFERLPNAHGALGAGEILFFLLLYEGACLIRMIQTVKLAHYGGRFGSELAETLLRAIRIVTVLDEIVPLFQTFQRTIHVASSSKPLYWQYPMRRAIVTLLLLAPGQAWCWGDEGHQIVARIAAAHLTERAREAVERLLRQDATFAPASGTNDSLAGIMARA